LHARRARAATTCDTQVNNLEAMIGLLAATAALRPGLAIHSRASASRLRQHTVAMSTFATFKTTKGDFKAELFMDQLPITCSNFADLSKTGFYDGLHFHRVSARRPSPKTAASARTSPPALSRPPRPRSQGLHVPVRLPQLGGPQLAARWHGRA